MLTFLLGCAAEAGVPADGVVVMELFTSESCSDCPAAEAVLADYVAKPGVFPVAWHVDYWNNLGWVDPVSTPEATARQKAVAQRLGARMYTPQLVVNGVEEMIGSNRGLVDAAVARSAAKHAPARVAVTPGKVDGDHLDVAVTVDGAPGAGVEALLLEKHLVQAVPSGENAGKTLSHDDVVRAWAAVPAGAKSVRIGVPRGLDRVDLAVLVVVRDGKSAEVRGAAEAAVPR